MLMALKGEIAELWSKNMCIFEEMWTYELEAVDMKF